MYNPLTGSRRLLEDEDCRLTAKVQRLEAVVEELEAELLGRVDNSIKLIERQAEVERLKAYKAFIERYRTADKGANWVLNRMREGASKAAEVEGE